METTITRTKIGDRIKERRKELRLTQKELGKQIQVTQKQISKYENNESKPPIDQLQKLSEILDVSTDWLLSDTIQISKKGSIHGNNDMANRLQFKGFSKQQLELIEITDEMTDQEQAELLGAIKMFLTNKPKNPQI